MASMCECVIQDRVWDAKTGKCRKCGQWSPVDTSLISTRLLGMMKTLSVGIESGFATLADWEPVEAAYQEAVARGWSDWEGEVKRRITSMKFQIRAMEPKVLKALGVPEELLTGSTDFATSEKGLRVPNTMTYPGTLRGMTQFVGMMDDASHFPPDEPPPVDKSGKLSHAGAEHQTEAEFLATYKVTDYPRPSVTVDLVIFTVVDSDLKVLLILRDGHPFRGCWALPGGFVDVGDSFKDQGEDLEAAAHRELEEETHLPRGSCFLEQLYTFGRSGRDPRTRVISVAYYALVRPTLAPMVSAGDDAADARWFSVEHEVAGQDPMPLAFDHAEVLRTAVERIRGKMDYAPITHHLVPETFTVGELRAVYEAIKGTTYDPKNFHRRFRRMIEDGVILPAVGKRVTGARPAKVYQFRKPARA